MWPSPAERFHIEQQERQYQDQIAAQQAAQIEAQRAAAARAAAAHAAAAHAASAHAAAAHMRHSTSVAGETKQSMPEFVEVKHEFDFQGSEVVRLPGEFGTALGLVVSVTMLQLARARVPAGRPMLVWRVEDSLDGENWSDFVSTADSGFRVCRPDEPHATMRILGPIGKLIRVRLAVTDGPFPNSTTLDLQCSGVLHLGWQRL